MADGFDQTTWQSDGYLQKVEAILYHNNWAFNEGMNVLQQFGPEACSSGPQIQFAIKYGETDNGGTFTYSEAMPTSDDEQGTYAYFTKDAYQKAARTYKMLQQYEVGAGRKLPQSESLNSDENALKGTAARMRAQITSTVISDLETQIDSSGNYGDNGISRATYNLASYEDTSGGDLSFAHMENAIEAAQGTTYGGVTDPAAELDICMPRNQITNFGRLGAGNAGKTWNEAGFMMMVNAQDGRPIDAGRISKTKTFEGINIHMVPGMTTTNILILRKGTNGMYTWWPFNMEEKQVAAAQRLWHMIMGVNAICRIPTYNLKISGLNA